VLKVIDVHKRFDHAGTPVPVLDGVSFELPAGGALAVVGPSGSGKSTLLHLIGALDRPTRGRIEVAGRDPHVLAEPDLARFRNRTVGFVFQEHHLLPQYSVLENVLLPSRAFPRQLPEGIDARSRTLLERVGLGHRLDHRPAELSGGERQRAAVARALVLRPALLLCDEPTGSLDARNAEAVGEMLLELQREDGCCLVVVTHSADLARRVGRQMALQDGRCIER
jgi:lipoprotein-releasing system ATP-binding protein